MFRKLTIALIATAALSIAVFAPTSASAWEYSGWHRGGGGYGGWGYWDGYRRVGYWGGYGGGYSGVGYGAWGYGGDWCPY